jgi:two-component system, sensor histidine kinase and response regulator
MKRVLVIDDTAEIREVISECLSYQGHDVRVAADGPAGIRLAQDWAPDLIICDVNMPGLDGYSVLLAVRKMETTATTPFVFLTGVADKIHVRRGMELGADDYLTKPFTQKELKAAVSARLEKQAEVERQTDRRLDELRGSLTLALPHELRTPLNGILGLSSILIEDYATCSPEEVLSSAQDIHTSAQRLHHLIENFLVFSQIQLLVTQKRKLPTADLPGVSGRDVIPGIATGIARRHRREKDLCLEMDNALFEIPGENLRKICEETIDNAFKFSRPGSLVCVKVTTSLASVCEIEVKDLGRGMTADQIGKIGPHVQFDRHQFEQQGAGLGLIIAKRMTELLEGQFVVQSVPGQGTTIRISFPKAPPSTDTIAFVARQNRDGTSAAA